MKTIIQWILYSNNIKQNKIDWLLIVICCYLLSIWWEWLNNDFHIWYDDRNGMIWISDINIRDYITEFDDRW